MAARMIPGVMVTTHQRPRTYNTTTVLVQLLDKIEVQLTDTRISNGCCILITNARSQMDRREADQTLYFCQSLNQPVNACDPWVQKFREAVPSTCYARYLSPQAADNLTTLPSCSFDPEQRSVPGTWTLQMLGPCPDILSVLDAYFEFVAANLYPESPQSKTLVQHVASQTGDFSMYYNFVLQPCGEMTDDLHIVTHHCLTKGSYFTYDSAVVCPAANATATEYTGQLATKEDVVRELTQREVTMACKYLDLPAMILWKPISFEATTSCPTTTREMKADILSQPPAENNPSDTMRDPTDAPSKDKRSICDEDAMQAHLQGLAPPDACKPEHIDISAPIPRPIDESEEAITSKEHMQDETAACATTPPKMSPTDAPLPSDMAKTSWSATASVQPLTLPNTSAEEHGPAPRKGDGIEQCSPTQSPKDLSPMQETSPTAPDHKRCRKDNSDLEDDSTPKPKEGTTTHMLEKATPASTSTIELEVPTALATTFNTALNDYLRYSDRQSEDILQATARQLVVHLSTQCASAKLLAASAMDFSQATYWKGKETELAACTNWPLHSDAWLEWVSSLQATFPSLNRSLELGPTLPKDKESKPKAAEELWLEIQDKGRAMLTTALKQKQHLLDEMVNEEKFLEAHHYGAEIKRLQGLWHHDSLPATTEQWQSWLDIVNEIYPENESMATTLLNQVAMLPPKMQRPTSKLPPL